jgi:cell division protein FtsZ
MAEEMKREVAGDGVPDYSGFDHPTVIRNAVVNGTDEVDFHAEKDLEYLDIPAFLRRQAD